MFSRGDVAITAVAVCAVSMILPSHYWSLSYICSDVGLYVFAAVAYFLLCQFRPKPAPKKLCQDKIATEVEVVTVSQVELSATVQDEAEEIEQHEEPKFNVTEHIDLMQKHASARNISGTIKVFRIIQQSGVCLNSLMYNIVLQAWINCGNIQAAEDWMEDIKEAGMADELSFNIVIKALVKAYALDKAKDALEGMQSASVQPSSTAFDEVLGGFARESRFSDGLALVENMHAQGAQPTGATLNNIAKLMNGARNIDQSCGRMQQILSKYNLDGTGSLVPVPWPRLAALISQAKVAMAASCAHEVHVTGSFPQIKAVRRRLKQQGFLDKSESCAWPLDGHWETDHGLTVVVEGKMVRWSGQRASKLRFTNEDRSKCTLMLYGEVAQGTLVSPALAPDASKSLRWNNGDVWHSYGGRVIGSDTLHAQTMTKMLKDNVQDQMYSARAKASLKCVSKQALGLPSILDDTISQFLGNDLYHIRVQFESKWNPSALDEDELPLTEADNDICGSLSRRHPRVGLRHCWAERDANKCGQRTLVNGEEVDENAFSRHVRAVQWA